MIDLDNLERTLELANDYVDDGLHFLTEPVSYGELKLLVDRLISAEKDAARYRFMRDMSDDVDVSRFFHVEISERDAAIDEAMRCSK